MIMTSQLTTTYRMVLPELLDLTVMRLAYLANELKTGFLRSVLTQYLAAGPHVFGGIGNIRMLDIFVCFMGHSSRNTCIQPQC